MKDRFLRACMLQPTDATPVWFMRQAGRFLPEYRALRERYSMLELCQNPELTLEVTLQPLALGMDAAILFADILLILEPMGAPFDFIKDEGPVIERPLRDRSDVERLRLCHPEEDLPHVFEAIRLIRRELDGKTPLIGFAGAPFTIASYLLEGGRSSNYINTKTLMWRDPDTWHLLMDKVSEVVRRYLRAQIDAGVQAVQLFDSWVGSLAPDDYRRFVQPHVGRILDDVVATGLPVIHFGTNTSTLLEAMRDAGGTVIGVDWRVPLTEAWRRIGFDRAIQGNIDPLLLCAPVEVAIARTREILSQVNRRPGHIFNVGHGIVPQTPRSTVQAVIEAVHEYGGG